MRTRSRPARLAIAVLAALPAMSSIGLPAAAADPGRASWGGSWTASPMGVGDQSVHRDGFVDQTVRNVVHLATGGPAIRVRLSNDWGAQPLAVGQVAVADRDDGAAVKGGHVTATFGGRRDVVLAPGTERVSDPVPFPVRAGDDVAVSIYLPGRTGSPTFHQQAQATSYLSVAGNHAEATGGAAYRPTTSWFFLSGVEVSNRTDHGTIVAFGDSITDGVGSTLDANHRYPDFLARRLAAEPARHRMSVVNEGIGGNRLLTDSLNGAERKHESAQHRFDRDVLGQADVRAVVVLLGTNDLASYGGNPDGTPATLPDFVAGFTSLIARAHAHGLVVVGGTVPPSGGPADDPRRLELNQWIRTSGAFDAVADFDAVLRDPSAPGRLAPTLDSGDHVHPNDAGYEAMAQAVPLPPITGTPYPQVIATGTPVGATAPFAVDFSGTATSPIGRPIVSYQWSFGDGTLATGASVRHVYAHTGDYVAQLTATDDHGRRGAATVRQQVTDPRLCPGLDQGCQSAPVTDDTFVRGGTYAGQTFGAADELVVKSASAAFTRDTLIRFDLTELSLDAGDAAVLRLFADANPAAEIEVRRVGTDWTEAAVTWSSRPALVGTDVSGTFTTGPGGWHGIEVSGLIAAVRAAGETELAVVLTTTTPTTPNISFASKERGGGAFAPQLLVEETP